MSDTISVNYDELVGKISDRLVAAGLSTQAAGIEASIMAEADLHGVPSHGVRMLPGLLKALADGRVAINPHIHVVREFGAIKVIDYDNGPGRFAAQHAMQQAVNLASNVGVGVCLAKNTTHWGRAHAYANRAAQAGFVGICTTNAMPTMAIGGATHAVIGNNPLAIGIPGVTADEPFVLDMAMSQAAVGKVTTWLREGKPIPTNWGLDKEGKATSDAREILQGAVLPMGEHKGAGLAVMIELLTAALAGASFTHNIGQKDMSGIDPDASKLFIALNVNAFIGLDEFRQHAENFITYAKTDAAPFSYPGERGWKTAKQQRQHGVNLHAEIIKQLNDVGVEL